MTKAGQTTMLHVVPEFDQEYTTGELRAALQPVVFLRLSKDVGDDFPAGTLVSAQYWGNGKVVLTRFPDGKTAVPVAHQVKGRFVRSGLADTAA